ncbi:arylformamidase [Bacillus cereus]|uniref:Kynurenine formamidase n=1 Tax=Bacillus cereus TaxID=1396 RepID=A0A2C1QY64_BACCE|nr:MULTISPECIES: arylformamidase [Bacillus cereus group]EJS54584.1 kynurenine formamidase [Bacillus cereus BAG1X1-3]EOO77060.1 kynurenine formamidase [Bacillus cereus BAG1O-1]OSX98522.1 Kynurenine formamidase, bacterial [Bacillus mycoides]MED0905672.1 arylformamidase [Bacillus nitratireducens]MED0989628.1 arylformamidase [Bacillus nitratireducens]
MKTSQWIDISQPLNNDIATWPGDTPFSYEVSWSKENSGSVNVGKLTMSIHTGTHIDAPFHFDNDGKKVLDLDIDVYVGTARVIDVSGLESIGKKELESFNLEGVERLLLRTSSHGKANEFPDVIPHLRADIAPFLSEKGIRLIGVDVPSVDPLDDKELAAHHQLFKHGIHILENVVLDHVVDGDYELIALPLALTDADGSPVRAVIRPI